MRAAGGLREKGTTDDLSEPAEGGSLSHDDKLGISGTP